MVAMNIKYDVLENQNCLSSLVKTYLLIVKKRPLPKIRIFPFMGKCQRLTQLKVLQWEWDHAINYLTAMRLTFSAIKIEISLTFAQPLLDFAFAFKP